MANHLSLKVTRVNSGFVMSHKNISERFFQTKHGLYRPASVVVICFIV